MRSFPARAAVLPILLAVSGFLCGIPAWAAAPPCRSADSDVVRPRVPGAGGLVSSGGSAAIGTASGLPGSIPSRPRRRRLRDDDSKDETKVANLDDDEKRRIAEEPVPVSGSVPAPRNGKWRRSRRIVPGKGAVLAALLGSLVLSRPPPLAGAGPERTERDTGP